MVFQNYALYPHKSVYDNMAFGLKMRKFPKPEIRSASRRPPRYSASRSCSSASRASSRAGQRQRVAVAAPS
jgi:multiple sugar transport system ATP-binding protein